MRRVVLMFVMVLVLSGWVFGQVPNSDKCLETIPGTYQGRPVWLTWRISNCKVRIASPSPGKRQRVTVEDVVAKNILVTDNMVVVHPRERGERRYSHAQQKPAAILPSAEIKVPEKENAMLRDLQAQIDKLRDAYKLAEYEKELKALAEIYQSGLKTLDAKYKVEEFKKDAAPLSDQATTIVRFAMIDAKLTEEQKNSLELTKLDDGNWVWKPKPKQ